MSLMETATPFNLLTVKQPQDFWLEKKVGPTQAKFQIKRSTTI